MSNREAWIKSLEGKYPKYIIENYAGYPESVIERDEVGKPLNRDNYANGLLEGVHTAHFPDGKLSSMIGYKQGFNHGIYMCWYPSGQLYCSANYENGFLKGVYTEYYENGKVRHVYNKDGNGNYNGDYILYDDQGRITWQETYVKNVGTRTKHLATNLFIEPRLEQAYLDRRKIDPF
jgi:antitoxin component YwqK of YwqJK toxin-antitoxin module